jgi:uncharacterized damage-inducible protein DinB
VPDTLIKRFRRWFEHEKDAHAKVMSSLESIPRERLECAEALRAIEILAHIAIARLLWLARLGIAPRPAELFPKGVGIDQVAAMLQSAHELWTNYLAQLDEEPLARPIEYQSIDGSGYRNTLEEILTQLSTHSPYHRGQIAMLVRAAGGEPAATDFIYWCREPLPNTAAG